MRASAQSKVPGKSAFSGYLVDLPDAPGGPLLFPHPIWQQFTSYIETPFRKVAHYRAWNEGSESRWWKVCGLLHWKAERSTIKELNPQGHEAGTRTVRTPTTQSWPMTVLSTQPSPARLGSDSREDSIQLARNYSPNLATLCMPRRIQTLYSIQYISND